MRKIRIPLFLLILCMMLTVFAPAASADITDYTTTPQSTARNVLLVDMDNGKELYSHNADERAYPASTTKILTVLLAVEAVERGEVSVDDMVTALPGYMNGLTEDASNVGIQEGEIMSLRDLLYCAILPSANEACNMIAMHISGDIPSFVALMNTRAEELGCTGSHFANTNGMPDTEHYTTARDLYIIAAEALRHEKFAEICDTASYITAATNMSGERELYNSNALICSSSVYGSGYLYDGAFGVKTGHTEAAGHCLVAGAERGGLRLLCVVLGADGSYTEKVFNNFADAISLFDWAYGNFSTHSLLDAGTEVGRMPVRLGDGTDSVGLVTANDISAMAPLGLTSEHLVTELHLDYESVEAPVKAGTVLGRVGLYDDCGDYYGETLLLASENVQMDVGEYLKESVSAFLEQYWMLIAAALGGVILLVFVIILIRHKARRKKRAKR